MYRIMFVCHGNICRSPMAEFIFKSIVKKAGREKDFIVNSSATSTEEIFLGRGNPVYPPAREILKKHGLDPGDKTAVRLVTGDYDKYDVIAVMDGANLRNAIRIFGGDPKRKVKKLMSFCASDRDVSDPWYSGDFETAYNDISRGAAALYNMIISEEKQYGDR